MFVPPVIITVWSGAEFTKVKFGYVPPVVIPVPPLIVTVWSGAVLTNIIAPVVVLPDIPFVAVTLVTPEDEVAPETGFQVALPLVSQVKT